MAVDTRDPLPQRIGAGKRNLDLFLTGSKSSPICFYFEDEGSEELYKRFLSRLFPKYCDPLVICTGGKTKKQVLSDAEAHKLTPIVFVQDKDFDDLIGTLPLDMRVVTLNRYSFENYLLEPDALIELSIESKRRLRREEAKETLNFTNYFAELYSSYHPLAASFVVARKFNLKGVKTTKQPIANLVGAAESLVSEKVVELFREKITEVALAEQKIEVAEDMEGLIASALIPKQNYRTHADQHANSHFCGKHLLDLILIHIDGIIGTKLSEADRFEIAMRLILHISVSVFDRVRDAIIAALRAQNATAEIVEQMR